MLCIRSVTLTTKQYQQTFQEIFDTRREHFCLKLEWPQIVLIKCITIGTLKVVREDTSIKLQVIFSEFLRDLINNESEQNVI